MPDSLLPYVAAASIRVAEAASSTGPLFPTIGHAIAKACTAFDYLFTGALILTIVFALLAAIRYITKGSDPKEVATAGQMLIWAAVGFGVAILATTVPGIVASLLGASVGSAC